MRQSMLSVESLRSGYTGIDVLKGVSLAVADNAIIGVLGPNGAGKTALLRNPRLLLLDEPSLGLAPKVFDTILERVRAIHAAGASILIAEQNARKVLRMAHHCYVLENGAVAFDGPASELLHDPRIEKTYLGAGH